MWGARTRGPARRGVYLRCVSRGHLVGALAGLAAPLGGVRRSLACLSLIVCCRQCCAAARARPVLERPVVGTDGLGFWQTRLLSCPY
jgi:hypothetical protein